MKEETYQYIKIILLCTFAAIFYGVVNDQITARLCFKFFSNLRLPFSSENPTIVALVYGIYTTWWMGLLIGIILGVIARIGFLPRINADRLVKPIIIILIVVGILSALRGIIKSSNISSFEYECDTVINAIHFTGYWAGFIGGIVLIIWIISERITLGKILSAEIGKVEDNSIKKSTKVKTSIETENHESKQDKVINTLKEVKKSSMRFPATSIVRIHTNNFTTVGTGFFLGKNQIISCAHVISSALDIPKDTNELPNTEIHLDFPLVVGAQIQIARVILWKPKDDIAVLELGTRPPDGAHTAPLLIETDVWGHRFRVFGFPYGYDNGVWAAGVFREQTVNGWIQIEDITMTGFYVSPGFSGTPVWDEKLGGVVGLVIAAEIDSDVRTGYIIPTSRLLQAWPELSNYCVEKKKTLTVDRQLKVFLCHASSDGSAAKELYFRLQAEGMNPWFYEESLLPGQQWALEIPKAVRSSDVILICLSNNSITKSGYIQKEIKYALDVMEEKPEGVIFLIPIRLEECQVPERLRSFQWVNLYESQGYDRLIRTLKVCADTL